MDSRKGWLEGMELKELQDKTRHFHCSVCQRRLPRRRESYYRKGVCHGCYLKWKVDEVEKESTTNDKTP